MVLKLINNEKNKYKRNYFTTILTGYHYYHIDIKT